MSTNSRNSPVILPMSQNRPLGPVPMFQNRRSGLAPISIKTQYFYVRNSNISLFAESSESGVRSQGRKVNNTKDPLKISIVF